VIIRTGATLPFLWLSMNKNRFVDLLLRRPFIVYLRAVTLLVRSEMSSERLVNNQLEMGQAEAVVAGLIRNTA
jgi:hypothetical protein